MTPRRYTIPTMGTPYIRPHMQGHRAFTIPLFRRASLTNDAQAPTRVSEADAGRESAR